MITWFLLLFYFVDKIFVEVVIVVHTCNSSTLEAKAGESSSRQHRLHSLKKKKNYEGLGCAPNSACLDSIPALHPPNIMNTMITL
jgi:hypothetical protein